MFLHFSGNDFASLPILLQFRLSSRNAMTKLAYPSRLGWLTSL